MGSVDDRSSNYVVLNIIRAFSAKEITCVVAGPMARAYSNHCKYRL